MTAFDFNYIFADLESGDTELVADAEAALSEIYDGEDADLILEVGKIYDEGLIVEADRSESMKWWKRAADKGCREAVLYMHALLEEAEERADMEFTGEALADGNDGYDLISLMGEREHVQRYADEFGIDLTKPYNGTEPESPDEDTYGLFGDWRPA